jgi:hypothetical protein
VKIANFTAAGAGAGGDVDMVASNLAGGQVIGGAGEIGSNGEEQGAVGESGSLFGVAYSSDNGHRVGDEALTVGRLAAQDARASPPAASSMKLPNGAALHRSGA